MDLLKLHIEKLIRKQVELLDEIVYFTADEEDQYLVAQANEPLDEDGNFIDKRVTVRDQRRYTCSSKRQKLILWMYLQDR